MVISLRKTIRKNSDITDPGFLISPAMAVVLVTMLVSRKPFSYQKEDLCPRYSNDNPLTLGEVPYEAREPRRVWVHNRFWLHEDITPLIEA